MTEISQNYQQNYSYAPYQQQGVQSNAVTSPYGYAQVSAPQRTLKDEFVHQHKKNGLFERLYNGIKNLTGLGVGSKKANAAVTKAENGEITEEQARETIQKYRNSQANSAQVIGDVASVAASGATFFGLRKWLKTEAAATLLSENKFKEMADNFKKGGEKSSKRVGKATEFILKIAKSNTKMTLVLAGAAGIAGSVAKVWTGKINRIGSKEFTADKKDFNNLQTPEDKAAYKAHKKELKKAKRKQNRMNRFSGAINGLLMPVTVLGGAIAGVPLYLAGNTLNRYFVGNTNEQDKSFKGYVNNLKQDGVLHGLLAAGLAVPLFMKGKFASVFDKNLQKSFEKLKDAKLQESGYDGNSIYSELEDIIMSSEKIRNILNGKFEAPSHKEVIKLAEKLRKENPSLSDSDAYGETYHQLDNRLAQQIKALTEENIIAVKMKQISEKGRDRLVDALQDDCPVTYETLEKVQEHINLINLKQKYTVKQSLGAGTIAETYLVEGADGKQYCMKVLKKGITPDKIDKDKDKFIDIIKNLSDKTEEEKKLLIKNVENLAENIKKETDFAQEMRNAKKLKKCTSEAKVCTGVEAVEDIYIMDLAKGINLKTFAKLNALRSEKIMCEKQIQSGNKDAQYWLQSIERDIEKIKKKTPNFDKITDLSEKEASKILDSYQKLFVEQFYKIDKNGKVIHGDLHSGNIMIDIDAFKAGKKDFFTVIDTGNTIEMSEAQALRALKLSEIINKASVPDIVDYVLEGANLAESGLTEAQAKEKLTEEFNRIFFGNEIKLRQVDNDSVIRMANNIMRKYKIVPNDSQLNYNKARQSAKNSYKNLGRTLLNKQIESFDESGNKAKQSIQDLNFVRKQLTTIIKHKRFEKQQIKDNLKHLSASEKKKYINNPNLLKENSEDYLTYKLKQKWSLYDDTFTKLL